MTALVTLDRLAELKICYNARTGMFTRAGEQIVVAPNSRIGGYVQIYIDARLYLAHRLAFFMMTGKWPAAEIIHANDNRADNRWNNLRLVSSSMRGQRSTRPNQTGVRGVRFTKHGRFRAVIRVRGKSADLGTYSTIQEASDAYAAAALKYYGPEARTQ